MLQTRFTRIAALAGTVLVLLGLITIWVARATVPYTVYVSELGAAGLPTAGAFAAALLSIAAGGFLIAHSARHLRSRVAWLAVWTPALSLAAGSACFVVASQVTCTVGCPVPILDPNSAPQDLIHTLLAVLGFAAASFAMLQVGFAADVPVLSVVSLASGIGVAAITITGGMLSIVHVDVSVGAWLEFAGMTIAIGWVAALGVLLAVRARAQSAVGPVAGESEANALAGFAQER